jgi:hypothetical protein
MDMCGGVYLGVETEFVSSFVSFIDDDADLILADYSNARFSSFINSGFKYTNGPIVYNNFMASCIKHPFWKNALNNLRKYQNPPSWMTKPLAMTYRSGPLFLTHMIKGFETLGKTQILSRKTLDQFVREPASTTSGANSRNTILMICLVIVLGLGAGSVCVYKNVLKKKQTLLIAQRKAELLAQE